ncbi:hypothetical protein K501DRAFT_265004 [Backusella circina FSU 941]|nr:hypothetical protein K501DRAFT_265004 [Backusella circina FSU 941]
MTTATTTNTVTATQVPPTTDIVDDVELLAILGLSPPPTSLSDDDDLAVLDWDDTPELSEEEDIDDAQSMTGKRKRDQDDDLFAELDFIEVPLPPKKQRSFVEEDLTLELHTKLLDDEDIRLALDLISS